MKNYHKEGRDHGYSIWEFSSERLWLKFVDVHEVACVSFPLLYKHLRQINLKGGKFIWLTVLEVQSMAAWPCCFEPVVVYSIVVGMCGRGSSSPQGSQEAKTEEEGDQGPNIPLKGMPPVTQLPLTVLHLLKAPPPPSSWQPSF
jgi:hypothetical protein